MNTQLTAQHRQAIAARFAGMTHRDRLIVLESMRSNFQRATGNERIMLKAAYDAAMLEHQVREALERGVQPADQAPRKARHETRFDVEPARPVITAELVRGVAAGGLIIAAVVTVAMIISAGMWWVLVALAGGGYLFSPRRGSGTRQAHEGPYQERRKSAGGNYYHNYHNEFHFYQGGPPPGK